MNQAAEIIEDRKAYQQDDQTQTHPLGNGFSLLGNRAPPHQFDTEEKQLAAIKQRNR